MEDNPTVEIKKGQGVIHFIDMETLEVHYNDDTENPTAIGAIIQSVVNIVINHPEMVEESFKELVPQVKDNVVELGTDKV